MSLRDRLSRIRVHAYGCSTTVDLLLDELTEDQLEGVMEGVYEDCLQSSDPPVASISLPDSWPLASLRDSRPTIPADPDSFDMSMIVDEKLHHLPYVLNMLNDGHIHIDQVWTVHTEGDRNYMTQGLSQTNVMGYLITGHASDHTSMIDLADDESSDDT